MRWVAPTEKDEANHALEKRLWSAADQFQKSPASELSIFGVEKTDETGRLARMNLGIESSRAQRIRQ